MLFAPPTVRLPRVGGFASLLSPPPQSAARAFSRLVPFLRETRRDDVPVSVLSPGSFTRLFLSPFPSRVSPCSFAGNFDIDARARGRSVLPDRRI